MKNIMKLILVVALAITLGWTSCSTEDHIDEPVIHTFTANPTTLPFTDSVTFNIDAEGEYITLFDGSEFVRYTQEEMPVTYIASAIKEEVTPPADTVTASLTVSNTYSMDEVKLTSREIELILLAE